jgi:5-dehydro-4-deoxyglucarate dehydratase
MKAIGRPAGPVRAPLVDLDETELDQLRQLISKLPSDAAYSDAA